MFDTKKKVATVFLFNNIESANIMFMGKNNMWHIKIWLKAWAFPKQQRMWFPLDEERPPSVGETWVISVLLVLSN